MSTADMTMPNQLITERNWLCEMPSTIIQPLLFPPIVFYETRDYTPNSIPLILHFYEIKENTSILHLQSTKIGLPVRALHTGETSLI